MFSLSWWAKLVLLTIVMSSFLVAKVHTFEGVLNSHISQNIRLNIACDDEIKEVIVNDKKVNISKVMSIYPNKYEDWEYGYIFDVKLQKGGNIIKIVSFNNGGNYSLKIKQVLGVFDYILLFLLIGLPIVTLLYKFYFILIDKLKSGFNFNLTYLIIFGAIFLRIAYFLTYEYSLFQHDFPSHTDYIRFFAQNFEIAPPHKLIQAPQQPLYYIIAGSIYVFLANFNLSESEIFYFISLFSVILSIIAIIYAYKTLKLITNEKFIINIALGFLAFTPSFIYMSARINNDVLNMVLAIISLYYIIKSYKSHFTTNFYLAMIFTTLLFFTKLSSVSIVLTFFILLTLAYMNNYKTALLKSRIYIFSIVGVFILGLTLFRVYLPIENEFRFVNSGIFAGQEIGVMDINYFFSFNLSKLIELAQSFSYETRSDLVRRSFFTYQYGTMLFGEFDYRHFFTKNPFLKLLIQLIDLIAVIFVAGLISFFLNFLKQSTLIKTLSIILILNLILIIKFAFDYPSICNTDFRYFTPSFLIIGLFIAIGLNHLSNIATFIKKIVIILISILFILEITFTSSTLL